MTNDGIEFSSSNVFAALALFNQLTVPLFIFPITIPLIISCRISTRRIETFLSQPEIERKFEGVRNMARIICKSSESLDDDDDQKSNDNEDDANRKQMLNKLLAADTIDEEELLVEIKINDHDIKNMEEETVTATAGEGECGIERNKIDANCLENLNSTEDDVVILRNKTNKTRLKKQNQLGTSIRSEKNRLKSTTAVGKHSNAVEGSKATFTPISISPQFKVPEEVIVRIKGGKFSWDDGNNDSNVLEIDHLEIPKGIV
jgi:hypothetical protein